MLRGYNPHIRTPYGVGVSKFMERKSIAPDRYGEQLKGFVDFITRACAFTGHRPHKLPWRGDEAAPACVALREVLTAQIDALVRNGYTEFLSGMAEGTDIWAAQAVLTLREKYPMMKLHCILPCFDQSAKWAASSRKRYRSILEQADSIIFVNRENEKNCMLERDRFLVSYASVVLAVYNGEKRGGTAATVRYARKLERELIVVDPATLAVTHEKVTP